ncbi:hypothetical protein [Streptomyces hawaiiensis]|uniref:hypothetical protein n=1 Tax=Streptomyces hawaiiensis TaxID=67305 RepID=UPI00365A6150
MRLTLWTVAGGAWHPTDTSWLPLLSRAVRALDGHDVPGRVEPQVGSPQSASPCSALMLRVTK